MRRPALLLVVAVTAALIPAMPVGAAALPDVSSSFGGRVSGDGVVSADYAHPIEISAPPTRWRYVSFRIRNTGHHDETFTIQGARGGRLFDIEFHARGWRDVTDRVDAGTFHVKVRAGHATELYMVGRARRAAETGDHFTVWVNASIDGGPSLDRAGARLVVPPIKVWATDFTGKVRCTATFPRRHVAPGGLTRVRFALTNLTDHRIERYPGPAYLRFRSLDGTKLFESAFYGLFGGPIIPVTLRPGQTRSLYGFDARVRWPGPLLVQPVCGDLRAHLPSARLDVPVADVSLRTKEAIEEAASYTKSPFAECPPGPNGQPGTGSISPPDGRHIPPLTLRCWADVRTEEGFSVVDLHMVSPDDAPSYEFIDDLFNLEPEVTADAPDFFAARWTFVVTPRYAIPVRSLAEFRATGLGPGVYEYDLHRGRWHLGSWSICGVTGLAVAFTGSYFFLPFITGCDGSTTADLRRSITSVGPDGRLRTRTIR